MINRRNLLKSLLVAPVVAAVGRKPRLYFSNYGILYELQKHQDIEPRIRLLQKHPMNCKIIYVPNVYYVDLSISGRA